MLRSLIGLSIVLASHIAFAGQTRCTSQSNSDYILRMETAADGSLLGVDLMNEDWGGYQHPTQAVQKTAENEYTVYSSSNESPSLPLGTRLVVSSQLGSINEVEVFNGPAGYTEVYSFCEQGF